MGILSRLAVKYVTCRRCHLGNIIDHLAGSLPLTRRDWLRSILGGVALYVTAPDSESAAGAARREPQCSGSIREIFLGEELTYQIGFWLFANLGEARVRLVETGKPGLYRASLEGRTLGFLNSLLGEYRYAYVSLAELSPQKTRLRPLRFQLIKKRRNKESIRTVTFDYRNNKIVFSRTLSGGKLKKETKAMQKGQNYEDYLTLFYNFRNGCYGPLNRGQTYHLPLQAHKSMDRLKLSVANKDQEAAQRQKEANKIGKHFFVKFRIKSEDVSSKTGEIEAWLSQEGIPTKGVIKDVIFFGDLWGELVNAEAKGH
ncbi:MAG: DUF3108 domain-containing protein [Desulfobacterales bacterium]